jgi:hypothetical protein
MNGTWDRVLPVPMNLGFKGKIEVKGRRERKCKQLLVEPKETRRYWKSKEEALD